MYLFFLLGKCNELERYLCYEYSTKKINFQKSFHTEGHLYPKKIIIGGKNRLYLRGLCQSGKTKISFITLKANLNILRTNLDSNYEII